MSQFGSVARNRQTLIAVAGVLGLLAGMSATVGAAPDFGRDVAPLLIRRCLECHNTHKASAGLVLSDRTGLRRGGESGAAVVSGQSDKSLLMERVRSGEMPPAKRGRSQKLAPAEMQILSGWIDAGAAWTDGRTLDQYELSNAERAGRDWWSLQSIRRPALPVSKELGGLSNPIDAFIRDRLAGEELVPAPPADRRTLIRRLFHDLVGLPPSAEETQAFIDDDDPAAYEKRVDRLLNSPHFGERWARHWLDVVRFAETCGYERDQVKPGAWKYRDWVVQAINQDKPYDRFVLEQLAGDEVPDRDEQTVIATGFLRLGTWNDEPNDPQEYKYERLEDMVHVTGTAFLGIALKCARCHDHKFDPVPQMDYYKVANAFWAGFIEPGDRKHLGGPSIEQLGYNVLGWTDRGTPPGPLRMLKNGDPKFPGAVVAPGHLSLVTRLDHKIEPPPPGAKTTQRRLQLARWIVDAANPLTPRVYVNRLWLHHFGHGLVRSPNNFGFRGAPPTHPRLLDWLAAELIEPIHDRNARPWTSKRLHKLMVMSATYRQASQHPRQATQSRVDSGNRFWWRAQRRRRDAESLRDAVLTVSGQIDLRIGGASFRPTINAEALEGLSRKASAWKASPAAEQRRRSLYIFTQRSLLPPFMTTFDFGDTTLPCGQRNVTTVAPQALAMMNNSFVHAQSRLLARRVADSSGKTPAERVRMAWRFTLGRDPTTTEVKLAVQHLHRQRLRFGPSSATAEEASNARPQDVVLALRADRGLKLDGQHHVESWQDASGRSHHATQVTPRCRPLLVPDAINGRPAVRFNGQRQFLRLAGQVVSSQQFTVLAVVTDNGRNGHRTLFSNWNGGAGNSVTSLFVGTTGPFRVRVTDDFTSSQKLAQASRPFVLTARSAKDVVDVFQNGRQFALHRAGLSPRNLQTAYVLGQQGNIDGEFWNGDLAELLVFDRELTRDELAGVWNDLASRYGLPLHVENNDPSQLALESLCHVLLNANEFVYVD
ncbi:MAG: DUF1553 domain-containing protein [Planctomycetaceae bacterium]